MADRYLNSAYIEDSLGTAFLSAVQVSGVDLNVKIEQATSSVQGYMRNDGVTPPSTQDPSAVAEDVKLVVLGALMDLLYTIPEVSLALPENFERHIAWRTFEDLREGRFQLAQTPDKVNAVGGWLWSDGTSTGDRPPFAGRSDLEDW